jgi:hypothetical protein
MSVDWKVLLNKLGEPFAKEDIQWRAGATARDKKRAQALPYAEPRVYEDRLNEICGGDWSVAFIPWGETRLICSLTIYGVSRSSTGEFEQDKRNAIAEGTVAEAQAFKRACTKFGLGRYLYDLPIMWVDYDEEKSRLKETPEIPNRYLPKYAPPPTPPLPLEDEVQPATLTIERAKAMSDELVKLGYPVGQQLALVAEVLRKKAKFTELTDAEAFDVWTYAKKKAAKPVDLNTGIGKEAAEKLSNDLEDLGKDGVILHWANRTLGTSYADLSQVTLPQAEILLSRAKEERG